MGSNKKKRIQNRSQIIPHQAELLEELENMSMSAVFLLVRAEVEVSYNAQ